MKKNVTEATSIQVHFSSNPALDSTFLIFVMSILAIGLILSVLIRKLDALRRKRKIFPQQWSPIPTYLFSTKFDPVH